MQLNIRRLERRSNRVRPLQQLVEEAYARRNGKPFKDDVTPDMLSGLTLFVLAVVFQKWFEKGEDDIDATVDQVMSTLGRLVCEHKLVG